MKWRLETRAGSLRGKASVQQVEAAFKKAGLLPMHASGVIDYVRDTMGMEDDHFVGIASQLAKKYHIKESVGEELEEVSQSYYQNILEQMTRDSLAALELAEAQDCEEEETNEAEAPEKKA